MIELKDISKTYDGGETFAVDKISLTVKNGQFVVLLGESGCGKTTTLKMINRLIEPTSGKITLGDKDVMNLDPVQLRRGIGYVFQEIGLFPHMTIAENIGSVPRLLGWSKKKVADRVDELLEMLGLDPGAFSEQNPDQLSGGQRQRIGVARALAAGPEVMLMDEPFGALDPITRSGVQDEFRQLQKKLNLTVVMVTHDMMEALMLADEIAIMKEGKITAKGTPAELLKNPGDDYAEELLEMPRKQSQILKDMTNGEKKD